MTPMIRIRMITSRIRMTTHLLPVGKERCLIVSFIFESLLEVETEYRHSAC